MSARFLQGFRVLELSQYIPGPYAALMLADLGADVIKVEPPGGDPMRMLGPDAAGGSSSFHAAMNGGKRILRLDLKTAPGRETLRRLLARADVLVESYRPGVLDRLGFDRASIRAACPDLVHCAITGFGQTGPLAGKASHDLGCMALAGGLAASGTAAQPVMTTPPVADFAAGLQASTTIMAALLGRARGGGGAYIDIGLTDAVLAWQSCLLSEALQRGPLPLRACLADNGGTACYNIYETADGRFVTLAADESKFWANFCRAVGRPDWIARQADPLPQAALIAELRALFAARPLADWDALLGAVDCCWQPVLEPAEVVRHPQVEARGLLRRTGPAGARVEVLYPAWIDGAPPAARPPHAEIDASAALAAWEAPPAAPAPTRSVPPRPEE
ncbi:MAG: CoA transferase [Dongiaceae bacterium]